jgi:hypothetical protein
MSSEIVLNNQNSVKILIKYTELAQQKGVFTLNEAGLLKRAIDVLSGGSDPEINDLVAKSLLVQAVHKGQRSGAYTLSDAALLDKTVTFVSTQENNRTTPSKNTPSTQSTSETTVTFSRGTFTDGDGIRPCSGHLRGTQPVVQEGSVPIMNGSDFKPTEEDSLDDLSAPVPLKPREI